MRGYATQEQRDEIKRIGAMVFKGDIENEAFLVFSNWLYQKHQVRHLNEIDYIVAKEVIADLMLINTVISSYQ